MLTQIAGTTRDSFLRLTTPEIISQACLQKTTNPFQANSFAPSENGTKEGYTTKHNIKGKYQSQYSLFRRTGLKI